MEISTRSVRTFVDGREGRKGERERVTGVSWERMSSATRSYIAKRATVREWIGPKRVTGGGRIALHGREPGSAFRFGRNAIGLP
jgi:hypothetical protein